MNIPIDTSSVIATIVGGTTLAIFGSIRSYFKSINKELIDMRIRDAQYKSIIDNHANQLKDIWMKLSAIDKHIENTDTNVSILLERTKTK